MADEELKPQEEGNTPQITEETAKQYAKGGGIPKAIRKEVVAINKQARIKTLKKDRKGAIKERNDGMERFLEEFLKNGGNATQAALTVFNCSTKESAASMGSIYLRRARELGRVYMDNKGFGYGKMLDVAAEKMMESKTPEWWDRLMKIAGYEDFFAKPKEGPSVVNVIGVQKDVRKKFGFDDGSEEVVDGEEG
jgi:hypothetical protein